MTDDVKKGRIGSAFDDFLKEEGIYEEVQAAALKKVVAHQLAEAMREQQNDKGYDGQADEHEPQPARPFARPEQ